MVPLAFVDTETTGLDPDRHEVWEVALILRDSEGVEVERVWQLPVDLGKADAIALNVGHWYERRWPRPTYDRLLLPTDDEVAEDEQRISGAVLGTAPYVVLRRSLSEWAALFAELTHGAHLVGAVPSFDDAFLKRLLRANGACPGWHYHLIDVEALAAGWLIGSFSAIQDVGKNPDADGPSVEEARQAFPPWDSNKLSFAVGVNPDDFDRHTALGDARWATAIYEAVLGREAAS